MLHITKETCRKELRVELACKTPYRTLVRLISNTSLPEKTKDELKNEMAAKML